MSEFVFFVFYTVVLIVSCSIFYLLICFLEFLANFLVERSFKKHFLNDSSAETWCVSREEYVNNTICCYDCDNCIYNEE